AGRLRQIYIEARMSALALLAERYGVALEYRDVWDQPHVVSEETLRAVLAAMKVVAATDAEAEQALAGSLAARWREIAPPVWVVREKSPPELRLHLRAAWGQEPVEW